MPEADGSIAGLDGTVIVPVKRRVSSPGGERSLLATSFVSLMRRPLPRSQESSASQRPSPSRSTSVHEAEQQPSVPLALPSSHCSVPSTTPSPQAASTGRQVRTMPLTARPTSATRRNPFLRMASRGARMEPLAAWHAGRRNPGRRTSANTVRRQFATLTPSCRRHGHAR